MPLKTNNDQFYKLKFNICFHTLPDVNVAILTIAFLILNCEFIGLILLSL